MAKGMFALIEIDDVLANRSHRGKVMSVTENQQLMAADTLVYPTSRMLKGFIRSGIEVVLISSKRLTNEEREITRRWLSDNGVTYDHFVQSNDMPSLKRWLKSNIGSSIFVMAIVASNSLVTFAEQHLHKPHLYRVIR